MNKTVKNSKNYTKSELFTLANKIRKETGCNQSEAYHKAKAQLENPTPAPVAKVKSTRTYRKKDNGVRITANTHKHVMNKYNFKVGQEFPSVKDLANYMHTSVQLVYGHIRSGYFEKIF